MRESWRTARESSDALVKSESDRSFMNLFWSIISSLKDCLFHTYAHMQVWVCPPAGIDNLGTQPRRCPLTGCQDIALSSPFILHIQPILVYHSVSFQSLVECCDTITIDLGYFAFQAASLPSEIDANNLGIYQPSTPTVSIEEAFPESFRHGHRFNRDFACCFSCHST